MFTVYHYYSNPSFMFPQIKVPSFGHTALCPVEFCLMFHRPLKNKYFESIDFLTNLPWVVTHWRLNNTKKILYTFFLLEKIMGTG